MKALSVTGVKQLELVELDTPVPGDTEVRVKVAYCGICGSDFPRYFSGGVHAFPQVLGHEFSGVVDAIGSAVTSVAVGDRVAVAPLVPDVKSNYYLEGKPSLCETYSFVGSRQPGALSERVVVPAQNAVPLPDSLSLKEAALVEPLTVAIHGLNRLDIRQGDHVLVFGAGVIGNLAIQVLKARGVFNVTAVDISDFRLGEAKDSGADGIFNSASESIDQLVAKFGKPSVIVETSGNAMVQGQCVDIVAKGGQIVYVGTAHGDVHLPSKSFENILRGELVVTGAWMSYSAPFPGSEWRDAVAMLASGQVKAEPLISKIYTLDDKEQPFLDLTAKGSKLAKILYHVNEDL